MRAPAGSPRANSFHFVPVRDLRRRRGARCPLRDDAEWPGADEGERARQVWLRTPDRLRLFRTSTTDFDDHALARVKWAHGQLYADRSHKPALDDFARDLVKLRLARECSTCERRERCPGAFVPDPVDAFTRDDATVRARLAELRGVVFDVGCGEGRYLDALAPAAARGELRYFGLDPDEDAAAKLERRFPWAVVATPAVAPAGGPAELDHVLVLRSWNHLPDPRAVVAELVGRLRGGGTLLVADNVAFGLLRDAGHARAAERGPSRFEHYRNDAAADASRRLEGLPLALLEHHEVTPEQSNQWFLRYEKLPEVAP